MRHPTLADRPSDLTVSVVICAYTMERLEQVRSAIASVLAQTRLPNELLVVVDHNEVLLRSLEGLDTGGDVQVKVMSSTGPPGLSGARNTGVAAATGDLVAFLDDDAVADATWLDHLVEPMLSDDSVVGTGGTAVPVWEEGDRPSWFPPEFDWTVGCTYVGAAPDGSSIRNPLGCNMAFRRDVLLLTGGFNPDVGRVGKHPLGCEETELCIRIRQADAGSEILHSAAAVIRHHVSTDRHRFSYFRRRCYAEGLSKAVVARTVGSSDGLSSERSYVRQVIPRAVADGLLETARTRRGRGARRASAVMVGLTWTGAGFVRGTWSQLLRRGGA